MTTGRRQFYDNIRSNTYAHLDDSGNVDMSRISQFFLDLREEMIRLSTEGRISELDLLSQDLITVAQSIEDLVSKNKTK
jgi:hypothetical protein